MKSFFTTLAMDSGPSAADPPSCQAHSRIDLMVDHIWEGCKNEIDFLRNTDFVDYLTDRPIEVLLGIGAGLLSFVTLGQFGALTQLVGAGGAGNGPLDCISIAIGIARLPTTLATAMIKISFISLTSFITPYLEEWLFRGALHDFLGGDVGSRIDQGLRVLANAFLFTLYHVPNMLPNMCIIYLLEIAMLGIILASLRMATENRIASTTAHVTYNSLIFFGIFALA